MNRRAFLRSFGALAAAAVAGPALAKLAPTDVERLVTTMRTGLIEGQTFYFTEPITLDVDNLVISGCRFVFDFKERVDAAITVRGAHLTMMNCTVECRHRNADFGLSFETEHGFAMSNTFDAGFRS